jgi:hypothetical protein
MPDQILTETLAEGIQADAPEFAWIIMRDQSEHPGKVIARFATMHPTVYVLVADTLAEIRQMLPPDLEQSERQPGDPPEVVEVWSSAP